MLLRNHGHRPKYYNEVIGGNFRLDEIQAAVLRVKLKYLDSWTVSRQHNAQPYRRLFKQLGLPESLLKLPLEAGYGRHIYNQFVVRAKSRESLITYLIECNIGSEIYYPLPLHLQECFTYLDYSLGDLPQSESAAQECLALPIYPELCEEMQKMVVGPISSFYSQ